MAKRCTVRVMAAAPSVHLCAVEGAMFFPRCSCGWEGAFMLDSAGALAEGNRHVAGERGYGKGEEN